MKLRMHALHAARRKIKEGREVQRRSRSLRGYNWRRDGNGSAQGKRGEVGERFEIVGGGVDGGLRKIFSWPDGEFLVCR